MTTNTFIDPYDKRISCEEDYVSPPWEMLEEVTSSSVVTSSGESSGPSIL